MRKTKSNAINEKFTVTVACEKMTSQAVVGKYKKGHIP